MGAGYRKGPYSPPLTPGPRPPPPSVAKSFMPPPPSWAGTPPPLLQSSTIRGGGVLIEQKISTFLQKAKFSRPAAAYEVQKYLVFFGYTDPYPPLMQILKIRTLTPSWPKNFDPPPLTDDPAPMYGRKQEVLKCIRSSGCPVNEVTNEIYHFVWYF